jgi:hypothetical protein
MRWDQAHVLVQEMVERLSDVPLIATAAACFEVEPVVERFVHRSDSTQVLVVTGTTLPHNQSIVVLTAKVTSVYQNPA